jgi:hypothetical protein
MSAKHLARLRAQQDTEPAVVSDSGTESDAEDDPPQQLTFNPFDLIQDDEDSTTEGDADAASPPSESTPQPAVVPQQQQQRQTASKHAAKSHGKQKGGKAAAGSRGGGTKGAMAGRNGAGDDADLDQLLKEMDMAPGQVCVQLHAKPSSQALVRSQMHA